MMNAPTPPQQLHLAQVACKFMTRSDLKGSEVDTYAKTFNWLSSIFSGELAVVKPNELRDAQKKIEALETEIKELHTELDAAYARLAKVKVIDVSVMGEEEPAELLFFADEIIEDPAEELEDVESETSD